MITHYLRLIRLGHELLAADRDLNRAVLQRHADPVAANRRHRERCQPIRDRLEADSLDLDDLALLRCMQEIASVRDEHAPGDQRHWSELPGQFDDVVSGVDHAIAAEGEAQRERAA